VSFIRSLGRKDWFTDIFYLVVGLLLFYSLWLGHHPVFNPDEGRYSEIAREMVASGDFITPRVNGIAFLDKPILYYWLQAAAIYLFGVKEWALRLFPMLLGILGCLITYICGRVLFNRRIALTASIILAASPLYFCTAHYADMNLEVAVFISGALLFFITGLRSTAPSRHYFLLLAYVCSAFAVLTKGLIGIAFPIMIIGAWILCLRDWAILIRMHLIKGLILFFIIVIPWYFFVHQANPAFLHYFFITQQVSRFVSDAVFNNPSPIWFYVPIIIIGFFPWTIFLVQALIHHLRHVWQNAHSYPIELFLLLWTGIIFIFFSIPNSKIIGYILPIFPPLALLTAAYLDQFWKKLPSQEAYTAISLFIILGSLLAGVLFAMPYYHWLEYSVELDTYLIILGSIIVCSSLLMLLTIKKSKLTYIFLICIAMNITLLLFINHGAKYLNLNSAKPLTVELKTILKPEDEVIAYFKYYQDVPLYLERPIKVVADWNDSHIAQRDNWVREFWLGIPFQNANNSLIDEDYFWQSWESEKRVFVFVNENYFVQFKEKAKKYFFIEKNNDIILLSNKPTYLSKRSTHFAIK
jgi:4-amino-4-deoxy-L-arabinose transferase-like glycosyltransferase